MVGEPWLQEPHTLRQERSKSWFGSLQTIVCNSNSPKSPAVINNGLGPDHSLEIKTCHGKQPLRYHHSFLLFFHDVTGRHSPNLAFNMLKSGLRICSSHVYGLPPTPCVGLRFSAFHLLDFTLHSYHFLVR